MKKLNLLLGMITGVAFALNVTAQPNIQWKKSFGGLDVEMAYAIQQTNDLGYVVAGSANSTGGDISGSHGDFDFWVIKLNEYGGFQFKKSLGGSSFDEARAVQQTTDGGYIVAGVTKSNDGNVTGNHGGKDFWIVKLSSTGTIEWQKTYGGTGDEVAYAVKQTTDGGYVVVGETGSSDGDVTGFHGNLDYWIIKIDGSGTLEWQKALGGTEFDVPSSVLQTPDGGYIINGNSSSYNGDVAGAKGAYDFWVVKLDATGAVQWKQNYGGSGYEYGNSIQLTSDLGYVMLGHTQSSDGDVSVAKGHFDYWVVKIDSTGSIQWDKSYGGSGEDYGLNLSTTGDGGYFLAGNSYSMDGDVTGNHTYSDYWVVRIDSVGNLVWQKCLGGTAVDIAYTAQQTNDWGYIVAGYSKSGDGDVTGNHGHEDYWVVKFEGAGVGFNEQELASAITIFPNPAKNEIQVHTEKNFNGLEYTIYDQFGKSVLKGILHAQNTVVPLNTLSEGLYYFSIGDQVKKSFKLVKE